MNKYNKLVFALLTLTYLYIATAFLFDGLVRQDRIELLESEKKNYQNEILKLNKEIQDLKSKN